MRNRIEIGRSLLGEGVEIGAYFSPWPLPSASRVHYVDLLSHEDILREFAGDPNLRDKDPSKIPVTDFIGSGECLPWFPDGSLDFVVSSHAIEHFVNPIGALESWIRKVRPGGTIAIIAPNKDHTFDKPREITAYNELRDAWNWKWCRDERRYSVFMEWRQTIDHLDVDVAAIRALEDYEHPTRNVHFSVWDYPAWEEFITSALRDVCAKLGVNYSNVEIYPDGFEMYAVFTVA